MDDVDGELDFNQVPEIVEDMVNEVVEEDTDENSEKVDDLLSEMKMLLLL